MNNTSLPPRPIRPIIVLIEDEAQIIHRPPFYFCSDTSCYLCHKDPDLIGALQALIDIGEVTPEQALVIYWNLPQEGSHA